jgi:hypothetical protein
VSKPLASASSFNCDSIRLRVELFAKTANWYRTKSDTTASSSGEFASILTSSIAFSASSTVSSLLRFVADLKMEREARWTTFLNASRTPDWVTGCAPAEEIRSSMELATVFIGS